MISGPALSEPWTETTVESKVEFQGRIITLRVDRVRLPNGRFTTREIAEHSDSVCVVPLDGKGNILMVRQFRKPLEDQLLEVALEAGAEDLTTEGNIFAIYTSVENFEDVKQALQAAGFLIETSELTMLSQNDVHLANKPAEQMLRLMDALEDLEDVGTVYANFDIDEAEMESLTADNRQ